ncbi:MAG: tRNA (adenosine(37)-N6)-threonylcarbamoyltransferase complex ATPase subunit type 1 TsaE [Solirubrobacteraceae bacterium]|jgi:tRNA threonylcarbamoyladenosine biosynthesis protein TsaE
MMGNARALQTCCSQETETLAAELAATLSAGDVVLLEGELGAGKTTFVRGACRALGVRTLVTSPTFTIGQLYPAPVTVAHVDLYRLADLDREDPDLLADYLRADTISFVEWPDVGEAQIAALGRRCRRVRICHAGADRRTVEIG